MTFERLAALSRGPIFETFAKSAAVTADVRRSVFLSYSSRDSQHVGRVIQFLERFGAKVYVDKADSRLPETPSVETAKILADAINQSRRLIVLVSPISHESKWVPWELGLGHGLKAASRIATFPIGPSASDETWTTREYLGLYPRIREGSGVEGPRWQVADPSDGGFWELGVWLNDSPQT